MPHQLRRGAGLLRHNAGRYRGLLLRGLPGPEAGERGAAYGRQAVGERGSELHINTTGVHRKLFISPQ